MKLWHVAQWGNEEEGPNGQDINCIVRAPDLETAVEIAELNFEHLDWKDGQCDVIYLMGEDSLSDEKARIIVYPWLAHAYNLGGYSSWHRDSNSLKWLTSKEMFG